MYSPVMGKAISTLVLAPFLMLVLLGLRQLRSPVHDRVFIALG
jgi:hypothetical protein